MKILIIGSGGREHTFAWKISQSESCEKLYIIPGNAGTSEFGENINLDIEDFKSIAKFVIENKIEMVVVGPEAPLVEGLKDYLQAINELENLIIIGPNKAGAQLEGSKDFSKNFMLKNGIPTGRAKTFTYESIEDGNNFLPTLNPPYVLKADGLAAGKGVIITDNLEEARQNLSEMLKGKFGAASEKVLIEEYLDGIELSVFVLTDGLSYKILPEAKDYKRIGENDTGANTGGMGAVSPVAFATKDFMSKVEERVIKPTLNGLRNEGIDYSGFLFIGLMKVNDDPYVIEYNVRMGDPETQAVFPRVQNDFVEVFKAIGNKSLEKINLEVLSETATSVVLVAGGYPLNYEKSHPISGLEKVSESMVFHAGTKTIEGNVVTNGGRVVAVTGLGQSLQDALENTYNDVHNISWDGIYFRKDIGKDLLNYNKK